MCPVPSPVRPARASPAISRSPTAAPSSSMKWASCPFPCRRACCACCRTTRSCAWAAPSPARWTCASSPPPTATLRNAWRRAPSAVTCSTVSTWARYASRPCASGPRTCACWRSSSCASTPPNTARSWPSWTSRWTCWPSTAGRATCANCRTWSTAWSSPARGPASRPATCRPASAACTTRAAAIWMPCSCRPGPCARSSPTWSGTFCAGPSRCTVPSAGSRSCSRSTAAPSSASCRAARDTTRTRMAVRLPPGLIVRMTQKRRFPSGKRLFRRYRGKPG